MVRELSQAKREKYLSAALKLFVFKGVQHTSTAEIAKEAGTAAGTLFLYFPTKQNLMDELILTIGKQASAYTRSRLDPALAVRETFFAIWTSSIRWFLENMDAYQYNQQVRDSGLISPAVVAETAKDLDYFFVAFQKGLSQGQIKPYPFELIGGILYQDIVAIMNIIRMLADPLQQEEIIQAGFEIFWSGIKAEG